MGLKYVFDVGDTIYYPNPTDSSGQPMIVKDRFLGMGKRGLFVQYLSDDLMDCLVKEMHDNINAEYDNLIVVTGPEGSGKSNFAYWLAKKFDPNFDIEDGYVYDMGPFLKKIDTDEIKGRVFWMDEATNIASARNWMKDENKSLIQLLEMLRSKGMTLIMCIPLLDRIDLYIRETRMRYHIKTAERCWDLDKTIKRGYFELTSKKSNFKTICWGTFQKIPEEEKAAYEALKSQSQKSKIHEIRERYEEDNSGGSRLKKSAEYNRRLVWILVRDANMSYQEISDETGIPVGTIKCWIHEMRRESAE